MKVAFNTNFGGYGLSKSVVNFLIEKKVLPESARDGWYVEIEGNVPRHNKFLIEALELFKKDNPGIAIIDIPSNCYYISEYDGAEDVIYPGHPEWIVVSDDELK